MVLARGLHGGAVRDQLGLQPSEVPTVAGGPASQGLPRGAGKLVLRAGGEDAVPFDMDFSARMLEWPYGMTTGFPQRK